jgi:hypothetical protein
MTRPWSAWILTLALSLGLAPGLWGRGALQALAERDDGPQVIWKGREATVYRSRGGKLETEKRHGAFDLALPGLAAAPLRLDPRIPAHPPVECALPEKVLAVSDIHGRFDTLRNLLRAHKVVDGALRWRFGKGHLVIVGDVMDRGSQVTECYWFLRALEEGARRSGGRVHLLLGNHEVMVMAGDRRYAHPKYERPPEGWPPLSAQYGKNSELGRWLRTRPVLLKLGSFLFIHGGISPELAQRKLSLEALNRELWAALESGPGDAKTGLLGASGPLWYRGLLPEGGPPQASDEAIASMLQAYGAKAFVVGHTTLDRIGVFHGGRVFGIDAGIKDGQAGEAWIWENGRVWRGTAAGGREPLSP